MTYTLGSSFYLAWINVFFFFMIGRKDRTKEELLSSKENKSISIVYILKNNFNIKTVHARKIQFLME